MTATMRIDTPTDRYGRHVTSPNLPDTDLATDVVARGLAERRVWLAVEERWQDEEPECEE